MIVDREKTTELIDRKDNRVDRAQTTADSVLF